MGLFDAIASIGDAFVQKASAQQQNQAASDQARASMDFSAQQVKQQDDFQERMSDTAHQREVADLQKAGLNPLLSVNAGASTPSGGAASGVAAPVVLEMGPAVSSALDSLRLLQDLRESNSRVLKNSADTRVTTDYAGPLKESQGEVLEQQKRLLMKQNDMLEGESQVMRQHPMLTGWMKVLADRGVGVGSALSLLGE